MLVFDTHCSLDDSGVRTLRSHIHNFQKNWMTLTAQILNLTWPAIRSRYSKYIYMGVRAKSVPPHIACSGIFRNLFILVKVHVPLHNKMADHKITMLLHEVVDWRSYLGTQAYILRKSYTESRRVFPNNLEFEHLRLDLASTRSYIWIWMGHLEEN